MVTMGSPLAPYTEGPGQRVGPTRFWPLDDNIVIGIYDQDVVLTREILELHFAYLEQFAPVRLLVDSSGVKSMTKDARDYAVEDRAVQLIRGTATMATGLFIATISNFFLLVSKPKYPIRLFTKARDARAWLDTLLD